MTGGAVAVRQAPFRAAAEEAFSLNHTAADSYLMFTRHLQGYGAMAGSDDVGAGFAGEFDGAAADAVEAYAALVHSFAGLAHLVNASATNHRNANGASTIDTLYEFGDDYPDADEGVRVEKVTPPSAEGGDGDAPDWWNWIADKVGYLYPDADTDLMRQAGSRWHQEADQLATFLQYLWAARDGLAAQVTPEASLGTATCNQLVGHVQTLAETFRALGDACNGFADEVDEHRDRMERELASFIAWTVGIQVLAHGLAVFTLGGSEVVGQGAQVAKIAAAANKVRTILAELAVAAALRYAPVAKAATSVRSLTVAVQPLVNASVRMARVRAAGVAGEKAAGIAKNTRRIASASRPGRYRIPDQLDDAAKVIGEVKNVKYQGLTSQLKDFLAYADARPGWTFMLYVRQGNGTTLSGPLKALVDAGKVVLVKKL